MRSVNIGVWLILRGQNLVPHVISEHLGISPTREQYFGHPKKEGSKFLAKTGLWLLEMPQEKSLSEQIDCLIAILVNSNFSIIDAWYADEAFVDIFIAEYDEQKERLSSTVSLTIEQLQYFSKMGLGIKFTS